MSNSMKRDPELLSAGADEASGKLRRRELLKLGASIAGAGAAILSMSSREARANGSWGGSGFGGTTNYPPKHTTSYWGTYHWRVQRYQQAVQEHANQAPFARFGK